MAHAIAFWTEVVQLASLLAQEARELEAAWPEQPPTRPPLLPGESICKRCNRVFLRPKYIPAMAYCSRWCFTAPSRERAARLAAQIAVA